jgi:hypothetical protein
MRARPAVLALWLLAGGAFLAAAPPGHAGGQGPADKKARESSQAEKAFRDLEEQFEKQARSLQEHFEAAKTAPDKEKARSKLFDLFAGHVEQLAKFTADHPAVPKAREALGEYVQLLGRSDAPAAARALRALMAKSPDKTLRGEGAVALGENLRKRSETAYQSKDKARSGKLAAEAEDVLERAVKDHVKDGKLARQARDALFRLKHLSAGKTAPDIEAEDMDGKRFKLSDYRGKVVVLDFWSFG